LQDLEHAIDARLAEGTELPEKRPADAHFAPEAKALNTSVPRRKPSSTEDGDPIADAR